MKFRDIERTFDGTNLENNIVLVLIGSSVAPETNLHYINIYKSAVENHTRKTIKESIVIQLDPSSSQTSSPVSFNKDLHASISWENILNAIIFFLKIFTLDFGTKQLSMFSLWL